MKAKIKWIVEFSVDETWVADGFNLTKERALTMLQNDLSSAYGHELSAKIISKPADTVVAKLQGFKTVAEFRQGLTNSNLGGLTLFPTSIKLLDMATPFATPDQYPTPLPVFVVHVWIAHNERGFMIDEHNYSISLPLGHPIPSIGAPFTPIPDGPILSIEEVQWEHNLTPTLILRGEIDGEDWAKIKEL